jgi:hypothetical protein
VTPLLAEPTPDQAALLEIVYRAYREHGYWPIFQYAEALLYDKHRLDALTVLLECPSVRFPSSLARYGWFWSSEGRFEAIQPGAMVGLTVAGMTRVPGAAEDVALFLGVLAWLARRERSFTPSPAEVQTVTVSSTELQRDLGPPRCPRALTADHLDKIAEQLRHEPSTWHGKPQPTGPGMWTATLSRFLRVFDGVTGPEDYVERLTAFISPQQPRQPAGPVSSLAVPEAIDYLNTVWRLHAGKPLLQITRAEAAAKLVLECGTADEFDARLSALCSILDSLRLPGHDGGKKLADLKDYLAKHLPADSIPRAEQAIDDLRQMFAVRAWRQHPGADQRSAAALRSLDIALPTSDWGAAWQKLQARAVAALASLREEIETLIPPAGGGPS